MCNQYEPGPIEGMQILVRLPNWLGDLVMSAGFVDQLHRLYPGAAIDVIVKKGIDELCQYFHGIRQVYVFDKSSYPGLRGAARFGRQLAAQQYDLAYCLPDSFSSAWMLKATGSRQRVGFRKELRSFLLTHAYNKPGGLHRVDQYVHLLEKHSGQPLTGTRVQLRQAGSRLANTVVVNVNSEADSRRLPVEKAISVLNALRAATDARLLLVGSPKELPHVTAVYDGLANKTGVENLAGTTNLHGLIGLFSQAPVMLTTDSGPMHLANALGVHTVALEGASDERNTAPYNKDRSTLIRYGQLPCEPCVKNTCRYGTPKCLLSMDNAGIVAAVLAALQATKQTT
jgi:lipopolysaccharide heptosyltransferase II